MRVNVKDMRKVEPDWFTFDYLGDEFELLLEYASAKDQREGLRSDDESPKDSVVRGFWLGKVKDMRQVYSDENTLISRNSDDGRKFLKNLWDGDIDFSNRVVKLSTKRKNFRGSTSPDVPGDAPDGGEVAA